MSFKATLVAFLRGIDDRITDRIGPIRVLFVVRNELGFINQALILQEMKKYPEIQVCTTSDGDRATFNFSDPALQALYDAHEIPAERAIYKKWHYLIATDILNLYFRRGALHVTTSHGAGFGNLYREDDWLTHQAIQPEVDFVFGMSPSAKAYIEAQHPGTFEPTRKLYFTTGFPKLDPLVNRAYSRAETLAELGLDGDRKTILISSHWTPTSMLQRWGAELLERLSPLSDRFNIILTAHPKLWELAETEEFSASGLWKELTAIEAQSRYIKILRQGNPLPLLNAADLLISGNSSIRIEYAVFDRPALSYVSPGGHFTSPHVQALYAKSSYTFSELDGLPELALKAINQPEALSAGNRELRQYFHSHLGQSAAAMTNIIRKIGRISSPASPRWKIARDISEKSQCKEDS